ncbi:MAG TPA: hypothetical protein VIM30_01690 [Candidatus Limnocylindrales bacterium]|jgi:hypothetical protein
MDSTRAGHLPPTIVAPTPDAVEFVRYCYRRKQVGWPELYDEMCGVAGRGLFRGWGSDELNAHGIGFALFQMPALAVLVAQVLAEDTERRPRFVPGSPVRSEPATIDASTGLGASRVLGASPFLDASPELDASPTPPMTAPVTAPKAAERGSELLPDRPRDPASVVEPGGPRLVFVPSGA